MEGDHNSKESTSPQRQGHENLSPVHDNETVAGKWGRLKKYTAGSNKITELEGRLLKSDNEALNLDPPLPTHDPPVGTLITAAVPTKGNKGVNVYTNAQIDSMYPAIIVEATLSKPGAVEIVTIPTEIARFCLQAIHIEKCYCFRVRNKEHDEILPLELFRLITSTGRTITVG
jgi:hypothetical protein